MECSMWCVEKFKSAYLILIILIRALTEVKRKIYGNGLFRIEQW